VFANGAKLYFCGLDYKGTKMYSLASHTTIGGIDEGHTCTPKHSNQPITLQLYWQGQIFSLFQLIHGSLQL